jgi:SAM-dependent methyltransferase
MTAWTEGYVADIPYALGFYRETVPTYIAFTALCVGCHPSHSLKPNRVLELGFGMGLGFVINAAANPITQFEGVDFNPLHVAHARGLIDEAELDNASVREASFQDLAREAYEGQHDLDLIVLHGILTWVSAEAHDAIVEIARKRLKPGGFLYASYNCMPGWAPVVPMQRLMRQHAKRLPGRSDVQTGAGIELMRSLIAEGAKYFQSNPALAERLSKMASLDKSYLAHEYLNANWFIFHFADVAEIFGRAKLGYIGSATLVENMDALSVPEGMRERIAAEGDPIFRETLRDIADNKQFRRDLYGRGVAVANPAEQNTLLGAMRFTLAVPRDAVSFKIPSPLGVLDGNAEIYGAVADRLANGPASFAELAALPVFAQSGAGAAFQAVTLFVHSGQVLPMPPGAVDTAPAKRLNLVLVEKMLQARVYNFLAAPAAGSGIQASHTDLLILASVLAGHEGDTEAATVHVIATMQRLGINWIRDGAAVTNPDQRHTVVNAGVIEFLQGKLPLWRQLGVL